MRYPKDWRFPTKCPACAAVEGAPVRVTIEAALLTVEVRCATCEKEWELSAPAPDMFLDSPVPVKAPLR